MDFLRGRMFGFAGGHGRDARAPLDFGKAMGGAGGGRSADGLKPGFQHHHATQGRWEQFFPVRRAALPDKVRRSQTRRYMFTDELAPMEVFGFAGGHGRGRPCSFGFR